MSSDRRGVMVDRSDLVGQYNSTDQSVFPGLDVDRAKNVPFIRRHPGAMMYQIQPVADGPAGPDRTRRPVGTDGIQALHDVHRPMAGGPVGPVFNSDPLGLSRMSSRDDLHQPLTVDPLDTDGIYAVDFSDWSTAGGLVDRLLGLDPMGPSGMLSLDVYNQPRAVGPVGKPSRPGPVAHPHTVDVLLRYRLLSLDPMGPSGMLSLDGYNQPPAVGPVGKPSRPGPVYHPGSEADCGQTIQLRSESEGANDVPDPVIQTGSDVQTDRMKIGTVHGETGSCDTPPSSDSGVHSLEEQWENMSTDSLDTTSKQTEGGPEQLDSETNGPMKTETAVRVDYAEMDCVLGQKPVKWSLLNKQPEDRGVGVKMWTIHECERETVCSDDRNSDIADMADFSDVDSEASVEFQPGPRTGGDWNGLAEDAYKLCDKPADNMVTICVNKNDIMNSGSDDRDSDIANMSDFSDDEDGVQEESRPGTQTGCVQDSSFEGTLYWCDRPTDNMRMTGGTKHDMVYSESDDRNSDIANISDFSDSDDQTQEEIRLGPRTGSDRCDSIGIVSEVCDRPVANTVTAEDDRDSLDPNDREYWTKFRLLTKRAFLLDDDCLSDSNFPEAVKDVVRRSHLTMMALDEYDAPPFDQRTNDGTPDCSDGGG